MELVDDMMKEEDMEYCKNALENENLFDRTYITPGTVFMNELNLKIKEFFKDRERV